MIADRSFVDHIQNLLQRGLHQRFAGDGARGSSVRGGIPSRAGKNERNVCDAFLEEVRAQTIDKSTMGSVPVGGRPSLSLNGGGGNAYCGQQGHKRLART